MDDNNVSCILCQLHARNIPNESVSDDSNEP